MQLSFQYYGSLTKLINNILYYRHSKIAIALLFYFFSFTLNLANAQANVKEYSDVINAQLTKLLRQANRSDNNFSVKFKKDLKGISDLFFTYDSDLLNPSDCNDLSNDQQLINDFKNYFEILSYYLDNSIDHNDSLLAFVCKDLKIKTATDFGLQSYKPTKKVLLHVKVMNKDQTAEMPGYSVFVKPYASVDPNLSVPLNPTNNAIMEIRPGDKKVSIYLRNTLIEEREVPIYYNSSLPTPPVIFIIQ